MAISGLTATTDNFQTIDRYCDRETRNILTVLIISVVHTLFHIMETLDNMDVAGVVKELHMSINLETFLCW